MFTRTISHALGIALLTLLLCAPARAQEIEVGNGIFAGDEVWRQGRDGAIAQWIGEAIGGRPPLRPKIG